MTERETLKLALDAFGEIAWSNETQWQRDRAKEAITAIKEVLAQPEQEPVAWVSSEELLVMRGNALGGAKDWRINVGLVKQENDVGLYTTPPQRKPLTEEEIAEFAERMEASDPTDSFWREFARAIEAAHGIKGLV